MDNIVSLRRPLPDLETFFREYVREHRPQQLALAQLIHQAIIDGKCAIAEAGTGVGKTLAGLVPGVLLRRRLLYVTHTKALQGQLGSKDLPFLASALAGSIGLRFVILKGASNYLCVRRFQEETGGLFGEAGLIPAAVAAWGRTTQTGDLDEAPPMETGIRARLAVNLDDCEKKACPFYGSCLLVKLQQQAARADVVVTNQAYLAAAVKNPFLWERLDPEVVIVDEAHHWDGVMRDSHAATFKPQTIKRVLDAIAKIPALSQDTGDDRARFDTALRAFRLAANGFFEYYKGKPTPNPDAQDLAKSPKGEARVNLVRARQAGEDVRRALRDFTAAVRPYLDEGDPAHQRIGRALENLGGFFDALDLEGAIVIARRETKPDGKPLVTLETFPVSVAPFLQRLHEDVPTIYMSATLAVAGKFAAVRADLGLPADALEGEFGSPFDYPSQALLYIPSAPDFDRDLLTLVRASRGRAFVLFTAIDAMRAKFFALRQRLGYPVRMQEPGRSNQELLDWFRRTPNAVLFGTASFWEGVSVEGEDLSLVVIDKCPFPPRPGTDPFHDARRAPFAKEAFARYDLPYMIPRLRQGFGRLVRTSSDRGVVAILDPKLTEQKCSYRGLVVKSLPPAHLVRSLDDQALLARYLDSDLPLAAGAEPAARSRAAEPATADDLWI